MQQSSGSSGGGSRGKVVLLGLLSLLLHLCQETVWMKLIFTLVAKVHDKMFAVA
jgi:hypothetical protein